MSQIYIPQNSEEQYIYDSYWSFLNPMYDNTLTAQVVVDFLKSSALEINVLKTIWSLSSTSGSIVINQFYTILRYVSLAQNNIAVTYEKLIENNKNNLPLPKFSVITIAGIFIIQYFMFYNL